MGEEKLRVANRLIRLTIESRMKARTLTQGSGASLNQLAPPH